LSRNNYLYELLPNILIGLFNCTIPINPYIIDYDIKCMNKRIFILVLAPIMMILSVYSVNVNLSQNVNASTSTTTQSYCPPICLDEVQQHVDDARDALAEGKIVEAASELDIVDALLDRLDHMTSSSD
jgi:hypothetical protein